MFEKNLNIGYLLDFYGTLLSDRKKETLDLYYNDDLSLSEIAEILGISRQGVRDIVKKAEDELIFFESRLGLAGKFASAKNHIENIRTVSDALGGSAAEEIKKELDALSSDLG